MTAPRPSRWISLPIWVEVITEADRRCECTRRRCHTPAGDRCKANATRQHLIAAPTDPAVPEAAAWRLSAAELSAWCGSCLDAARRQAATEAARAAAAVAPAQLALIEIEGAA